MLAERAASIHRVAVWTLALTSACLPLYVVRWRFGPFPTTLLELLILLTAAAFAVSLWAEGRLPAARAPYYVAIVLLLLAGAIGVAVAPDHVRALGIYRAYFVEAIAIFYVAVDLLRKPDDVRIVVAAAAAGSCLMAVGQIVSFVAVLAQHQLVLGDAPAFLNTSANAVAMYLEPPVAFAAAFAIFPPRAKDRPAAIVILALLLVAIVLTLSRASYLAIGILAVIAVLSLNSSRVRLWVVGALALVGLVVVEIPFINERLVTLAHSVMTRSSIYQEALQMLSERPIFGAGISGFASRVAPFRPGTEAVHIYPHNLWLTSWSELGLLGVIAFGIIFFGLLWRGWRAVGSAVDIWKVLIWGSSGALVLYLVHGMFDSPYWKNDLSVEFWILAALQVAAIRAGRTTSGAGRSAIP